MEEFSSGFDDGAPGSPKRKKVRAKYAPKACVACRRSKLKCSGANPCQRCRDAGRRCFYSEDQTAAEALQHLSRPTPTQPPAAPPNGDSSHGSNSNHSSSAPTNTGGATHRSIVPPGDASERRASDGSVLGLSLGALSLEERMARIEGMMELLVQERRISPTPRGSVEREGSSGYIYANADTFTVQPFAFGRAADESGQMQSDSPERLFGYVRIDGQSLVFPVNQEYQKYVDYFFDHVNPGHPCVNEAEFRARSERILRTSEVPLNEASFLALNYIIFACVDILTGTTSQGIDLKLPGWNWHKIADALAVKRSLSGRGDLSLVQVLLWEAIYLTCADKPNTAYNVIGLACHLCFQFGLNQQSRWGNCSSFDIHIRQRIFWTVYITDRRIAMCCGRPYTIRDRDIDVELPLWVCDRDVHPGQPLPDPNPLKSSNVFLHCMITWAKFVGEAWDLLFSPMATKDGQGDGAAAVLDSQIKGWTDTVLTSIPLLPLDRPAEIQHLRHQALVLTRSNHLRLLLYRRKMVSLDYDGRTGRSCGDIALNIVKCIESYACEAKAPSSFRFHMTASLGSAILVLTALLVRDLGALGLNDRASAYAQGFKTAVAILHDLASYLQVARRVSLDLKDIVLAVTKKLDGEGSVCAAPGALIPYTEMDFAQQAGGMEMGADSEMQVGLLYGVPWI